MSDLIAQIRACVDEDERVAVATKDAGDPWTVEPFEPSEPGALPAQSWVVKGADGEDGIAAINGSYRAEHIARHDPARVLRWVAYAREVLERHARLDGPVDGGLCGAVCASCGPSGNDPEAWLDGAEFWPCPDVRGLAGVYGIGEDSDA